ncbi:hypothetical protein HDV00_008953 [Rhizophlyctis rosea]|nr:hypothetical protein HDV00_008953 [Rhizophlyctis rosea]
MEETPENVVDPQQPIEEPKKKKRVISPEAEAKMLENLARAREQRNINRTNTTKYPKGKKRERAKEMYEADINAKAEEKAKKLAEELIAKKQQEEELSEFRKWKESQTEKPADTEPESEPETKPKKKTTKKAEEPKKATKKAVSAKPAKPAKAPSAKSPKTPKAKVQKRSTQPAESQEPSWSNSTDIYGSSGFNIDDFLG